VIIGFAAERGEPVARARKKLAAKKADMIVANDITRTDAGFDADTNAVTLVTATGAEPVALASKAQIAGVILDRGEALLGSTAAR
jgi:phosphopantothenoylcysteine decarboxylase/phosphopantothenate--cysteine ligase